MTKVLLPVDASDPAARAVAHAIRRAKASGDEIHLLNVQPMVPTTIKGIDPALLRRYHQEEGAKELARAEAALAKAGVPFKRHIAVGPAGETVAAYARESGCDEIVMGVRGMGAALNLLMGSTTTKVLALTDLPVTLIK